MEERAFAFPKAKHRKTSLRQISMERRGWLGEKARERSPASCSEVSLKLKLPIAVPSEKESKSFKRGARGRPSSR